MRVYFGKPSATLKPIGRGDKKYVIWGDWLDVEEEEPQSEYYRVNWRLAGGAVQQCRVAKADCRKTPLLEMVFLDVGQGDSCIVSIPDGAGHKILIVDAGAADNTYRFLKWRLRNVDANGAFEAAVITHPDSDHYAGFQDIFEHPEVKFRTIYHNGLVDLGFARGDDRLGERSDRMCVDLYEDRDSLGALLETIPEAKDESYTKLLRTALADPVRFGDIRMASTRHGETAGGRTYLPGFGPGDDREATIEILGPVPDERAGGALALREFGDTPRSRTFSAGKTKNGHSVILKLNYGGLRILFGGDLNRPSEEYLLRHYGEVGDRAPLSSAVAKASERLCADILKCCHHGSADVTDEFLQAVNPFGVVVSSGDQESHVHPRPEVLGLLGKRGRGSRPIILCTEILRSTPESLTLTRREKQEHSNLLRAFAAADEAGARRAAEERIEGFWRRKLRRLVAVYGAINVRTDGQKLIVAFRKEVGGWQIYEYELVTGEWQGAERPRRRRRRREAIASPPPAD